MNKRLVAATFLPHSDYGDIIYMNTPVSPSQILDAVYHGALRFITGLKTLIHHYTYTIILL